jgi:hypothetical protein
MFLLFSVVICFSFLSVFFNYLSFFSFYVLSLFSITFLLLFFSPSFLYMYLASLLRFYSYLRNSNHNAISRRSINYLVMNARTKCGKVIMFCEYRYTSEFAWRHELIHSNSPSKLCVSGSDSKIHLSRDSQDPYHCGFPLGFFQ